MLQRTQHGEHPWAHSSSEARGGCFVQLLQREGRGVGEGRHGSMSFQPPSQAGLPSERLGKVICHILLMIKGSSKKRRYPRSNGGSGDGGFAGGG